jgi:hypothetical protein
MAEKTLAEKLLIKPNSAVWVSDATRTSLLGPLPGGTKTTGAIGEAATAVVFADDSRAARAILDANRAGIASPATFWVAYPKGNRADINRDTLWPILSDYGMRPIGQVAIDETWSALRFRLLKHGEAPFTGGAKD